MKIIVSQQNKRIKITFEQGKVVDNYLIDKSDSFILALDKFMKKRKMKVESLKKADLKFENTGMLTERVIKSIMLGLQFSIYKLVQN